MFDIPIMFSPIDMSEVTGRTITPEIAYYQILSEKPDSWSATSDNRWYQYCLGLVVPPEYSTLRYFSEPLAILTNEDCHKAFEEITRFVNSIDENPQYFIDELRKWRGEEHPDGIRKAISEAQVLREFNDDTQLALGNFFTFLASLKFALNNAFESKKCFLYAVVDG